MHGGMVLSAKYSTYCILLHPVTSWCISSRVMVKRALLSCVNASMLHVALGDTANILSREGNFLCLGATVLHTRASLRDEEELQQMLHKRGIHDIQDYHAAVVAEGENPPTGCVVSAPR